MWVRVLDAVSLVSALLMVTVLVTGGFREWTPFGRISLTSWTRLALLAAAAASTRAFFWRADPLPSRVWSAVRAWWAQADTRAVLPVFLSTRTSVLIVGFLSVVLIGYESPEGAPWRIYRNELLNLPARYDTGWYLGIATYGYQWNPARPTAQQNIVFFPAYPMLVRYLSLLVARQTVWTGVLISWVAFFVALVYLYRLARQSMSSEQASAAITFLAAYPFALFFSTAYTEALFLLAMVGAVYHFGRDELWQAGGWGLLAGLTRPNGCLLSVVLALMLLARLRTDGVSGWRSLSLSRNADRLAVAALPGVGMIVYSTFIYYLTGDPLRWTKQQVGWGRTYTPLDTLVSDRFDFITNRGLYNYASSQTIDMLYAAAVVFVLASVWPVFRRFGLPFAALILINVIPPLTSGGLLSMGRMTSVLFPVFLWLGAAVPPRHRVALAIGFASLQALCAAMFFTWRPLY